jgi:hypothetical protein
MTATSKLKAGLKRGAASTAKNIAAGKARKAATKVPLPKTRGKDIQKSRRVTL